MSTGPVSSWLLTGPDHPGTGEMNVSAVADDRNRAHVHLTAPV
jgi:hypothetical protein